MLLYGWITFAVFLNLSNSKADLLRGSAHRSLYTSDKQHKNRKRQSSNATHIIEELDYVKSELEAAEISTTKPKYDGLIEIIDQSKEDIIHIYEENSSESLLEPVATHQPFNLEAKGDHVMRPFGATFLNDAEEIERRLGNKSIQTNKFWWNWIVENSKNPLDRRSPQGLTHPIFPQPYALQWSNQRLGVSHEPQEFVFAQPNVDNDWPEADGMRSYATTIRHAFQIGATTTLMDDDDEYSFVKESLTGVHVQIGSGVQKITFPIYSGMAYVTAKYEGGLTPKFFRGFYFLHNACMVQNGVFEATYGGPIPDEKMYTINEDGDRVEKPNLVYRFYLIRLNGDFVDESYKMIAESGELYVNKPFDGYIRVAQVGGYEMESCDDECLERLTESAPGILWDVKIDVRGGGVLDYSFIQPAAIAKRQQFQVLHWAYATHVALLGDGTHSDDQIKILSSMKIKPPSKGRMTAVVGNKWNMVTDLQHVSDLDFLPAGDLTVDDKADEIRDLAVEQIETFYADPHKAFNWPYEGHSTYYFGGKGFQKVSMVCLVAKQFFGPTDPVVQKCISILRWGWSCAIDGVEDGLEVPQWGCGGRPHDMIYDTTWGGTPSSDYYNENCGADFGNPCYNDHHYHYGYWITSAAMAVHLSPDMLTNTKFIELVNVWIRDTMNPSLQDTFFPAFRSFDLFDLHSWSRGLPHSGDGKDQESTSEEINLYYGIHLWCKMTGNVKLQKLAQTILSLNIATIREFFLFKRDNPNHPVKYARNHVSGMLFQRSVQFATWFGLRKEYVHGIQMLPLTPALQLARTPDFCLEEWEDILEDLINNGFGGNMVNNQWKSIVISGSQSMLKDATMRDEAYKSLSSLPTNEFDDGLTKVWALYWTASQRYQNQRHFFQASTTPGAAKLHEKGLSVLQRKVNVPLRTGRLLTSCEKFTNMRYDFLGTQVFAYPHEGVISLELCEAKCLDLGVSVCKYYNYREGISCQMASVSTASYSDSNVISGRCHAPSPIGMCSLTSAPSDSVTSAPTVSLTISNSPTQNPISAPTASPVSVPTTNPTSIATATPTTSAPSGSVTSAPTTSLTTSNSPTQNPISVPTASPVTVPTTSPVSVPTTNPTSTVTAAPTSNQNSVCEQISSHHFSLDTSCIDYQHNFPSVDDCAVSCQDKNGACKYFNYILSTKTCVMSCDLMNQFPSGPHGAFPNSGEQDAGICRTVTNAPTVTNTPTVTVTTTKSPAQQPISTPPISPTSSPTVAPTLNENDSCKLISSHHFNLDTSCIAYQYNVPTFDGCVESCEQRTSDCKYFNYDPRAKSCMMSCELVNTFPSGPDGAFPNGGELDAGVC